MTLSSTEEWRAVKGLEGLYEVSNTGRVRGLAATFVKANGHPYHRDARMLSWVYVGKDQTQIVAQIKPPGEKRRVISIKRLVYEAFVGDLPRGAVLDHRDGDDHNMAPDNLFIRTYQ